MIVKEEKEEKETRREFQGVKSHMLPKEERKGENLQEGDRAVKGLRGWKRIKTFISAGNMEKVGKREKN